MQFNFELPEAEANRVLDIGISRKLGTTRDTVSKAIIARALVLERLDELTPVEEHTALISEITVAMADPASAKLLKPKLESALNKALREIAKSKAAA